MIPIILLGEKDDSAVCDALYLQLNQNCAKVSEKDFWWNQHADFLLADSVQTNFLDAGGGLVILKESFCRHHAPKHLLHATCIFLSQCSQAAEFASECGLACLACGGSFDALSFSSMKEQMVLSVQKEIRRLDGTQAAAGDFPLSLKAGQEQDSNSLLLCAAALLMIHRL